MLLQQHLVIQLLLTDLAIEVQLPKLEAELGQQPIRLKNLLLQQFLPPLLLLDQEKRLLLLPPSDDHCFQLLLDQEDLLLLLPQLPMPHWKKASLSISFPLHLLQMGNTLWFL